jgi:hypothetical protein
VGEEIEEMGSSRAETAPTSQEGRASTPGSTGKSDGQLLCESFQAARPPSGWHEPLIWADFDDTGQATYQRAAEDFIAKRLGGPPLIQHQLLESGACTGCKRCARGEIERYDDESWVELGASAGGAHELGMWGWLQLIFHEANGSTIYREYVATDAAPSSQIEAVQPVAPAIDREAVARVIDPISWETADKGAGKPKLTKGLYNPPAAQWAKTQDSLAKADEIISLIRPKLAAEAAVAETPDEPKPLFPKQPNPTPDLVELTPELREALEPFLRFAKHAGRGNPIICGYTGPAGRADVYLDDFRRLATAVGSSGGDKGTSRSLPDRVLNCTPDTPHSGGGEA